MSSNCQVQFITLQKFGNENCENWLLWSINKSLLWAEIKLTAEVCMGCSKECLTKI